MTTSANLSGAMNAGAKLAAITGGLSFDFPLPAAGWWADRRSKELADLMANVTAEGVDEVIQGLYNSGFTIAQAVSLLKQCVGLTKPHGRAVTNAAGRLAFAKPGDLVRVGKRTYRTPAGGFTASRIQAIVGSYSQRLIALRARTIARTEINRAANFGQRELWRDAIGKGELPTQQRRKWVSTLDDRVREAHLGLHGEVVGVEEPFSLGFEPGEEVNCRCTHVLTDEAKTVKAPTAPVPPPSVGLRTPEERAAAWGEVQTLHGHIVGGGSDRVAAKISINQDLSDRLVNDPRFAHVFAGSPRRADDIRGAVDEAIRTWAATSGDSEPMAVAFQLAVKEEFGLDAAALGHFGEQTLATAEKILSVSPEAASHVMNVSRAMNREPFRPFARAFARAQYEATQEWLSGQGLTHVTLFRGAQYEAGQYVSGFGAFELQPASSFSTHIDTSISFSYASPDRSALHIVRVPIQDVLGSARTGFGCLSEYEVVLLSRANIETWTHILSSNGGYRDEFRREIAAFLGIDPTDLRYTKL